jgi:iron complex outermembrane receptor protein
MNNRIIRMSLALLSASVFGTCAWAQPATRDAQTAASAASVKKARIKAEDTGAFELGRIIVPGGSSSGQTVSQSTITADEMRRSNRDTLDDALRTVPGVEIANTGGSRNERLVYVRGFDRWQVPLYIDGVRIYLPADNRIDYGRFLTPDLAEIQVQKGYVPVLSGPGGMGGAVNLVTKTPTEPFEGEVQTGLEFGNTGKLASYKTFASVGTRQDMFYVQASGSVRSSNGWFLSRDFTPNAVEGGGRRDFSDVEDWRGNIKVGITPNDTDEYVISYTKQAGEKGAPYAINQGVSGRTPAVFGLTTAFQRDWTWPQWDIGSLSFNSYTAIGDASYVKVKAFYNTFDNLLSSYDDSRFSTQQLARAFDSYYDDHAYGVSAEAGTEFERNSLKAAVHYRRDSHTEWNDNRPDHAALHVLEPKQTQVEDGIAVALENTFHATDTLDLVAGVSYEKTTLKRAEEYSSTTRSVFSYPLGGSDSLNWQTAAIWRPTVETELHASISSRTRFPNMFERFSTRFGTALPNPNLGPERAINFEIGGETELTDTLRASGAVFYSDIQDVIQSVGINATVAQNQNVGDGRYYGFEVKAEWDATDELTVGGNYTYLKREITDALLPNLRSTGVPEHLLYAYATWAPTEKFSMTGSVETSSSRWSDNPVRNGPYIETDGFVLANLNFEYKFTEDYSASFGVRNLFDKNYELVTGFPEPGRTFYLNARATF